MKSKRKISPSQVYLLALECLLLITLLSCSTTHHELLYDKTYATASWYGPDFHGKPTSSGEIFNMHANTCAHKGYPFGTKLKVTNISNNKTVECIVNDRGPFVDGRDLDLSYAAARKIGLIGTGTGKVLMEVSGRDSSYIRRVKVQAEKTGPFAIQIGAFTESINAVNLKRALNLNYGNVYIQESRIKGTTYYRVRIGNFENLNKAVSLAEELGQEGYQTLVLRADVKI